MKEQEEWLRQQLLSGIIILHFQHLTESIYFVSLARKEDKGEDKGGEQDKGGDEDLAPTLKVTWKAKKGDAFNGGYTAEILQDIFSKVFLLWLSLDQDDLSSCLVLCVAQFGVHHILVSKKRNGKAIISFHSSVDAVRHVCAMSNICTDVIVIYYFAIAAASFKQRVWSGRVSTAHGLGQW